MKLELTERERSALSLAITHFDLIFFDMTEDSPHYRTYELAWADLERVSAIVNKHQ